MVKKGAIFRRFSGLVCKNRIFAAVIQKPKQYEKNYIEIRHFLCGIIYYGIDFSILRTRNATNN